MSGRLPAFIRRVCTALVLLVAGTTVTPASAQTLLPAGFFDSLNVSPNGQAVIEADMLTYDANSDIITASGSVVMVYEGTTIKADRIVYRKGEGAVTAEGNIDVRDAKGSHYVAEHVDITGNFQKAFVRSLQFTAADGSLITAADADFDSELEILLTDATYSPCGLCVDSKGRRIGWKVKAAKMVYVRDKGTVELFDPSLELLGIPVAWLPWLSIPDPSQPRLSGFRLPKVDYSDQMGATLELPYFWGPDDDTDVIFSPRLMTRQGALLSIEATHRFKRGYVNVRGSGVYQLDPGAFVNTVGDRRWRGAIQTSGTFVPIPTWTTGWSYTKFTDAAYLVDYRLTTATSTINEVYVTHLTRDTFLDLRVQEFNLLGNVTPLEQEQHAKAIPNFRGEHVVDLPGGRGQVRLNGSLLGVYRGADQTGTYGGVPYVFAYRETKFHAKAEVSWQKQLIVPGGFAVTPFAGLRVDAAHYNGASALKPGEISLLTATPIAALDVRWPLIAVNGSNTHIFEPIAQIVYRASDTALPGITNDDAQSFVLDESNIFSYDRFSGADRQETGLRVNVGGRYQANFGNGAWLELLAGESFFIAGANSLSLPDPTGTGLHTGLGTDASYIVLSSKAGFANLEGGSELQFDPNNAKVTRAAVGGRWWNAQRFSAAIDYTYIAADPIVGTLADQHEVSTTVGVPLADYWSATGGLSWDLAQNKFLDASAGLLYDDRYLAVGVNAAITGPTHTTANNFRISATFKLRGPSGEWGF